MLSKALYVICILSSYFASAQVQWEDSLYRIEGRTPLVGVLTTKGDTLLPFQFHKIQPRDGHRFLVYQSDGRCGLVDSLGSWVLPLQKGILSQISDKKGDVWILSGPMGNYDDRLFTSTGQEISWGDIRVNVLTIPSMYRDIRFPNQFPKQYLMIKNKEQQFHLLRTDGQVLLGPGIAISYVSDSAPVLLYHGSGTQTDSATAHFLTDPGRSLPLGTHVALAFTPRIDILVGQHPNGRWGFVDLNRPDSSQYRYDRIQLLASGYFKVKQTTGWGLSSPVGTAVTPCRFDTLFSPDSFQERAFQAHLPKIKLVAAARNKGDAFDEWVGLSDMGFEFPFKGGQKREGTPQKPQVEQVVEQEVLETASQQVYSRLEVGTPPAFPGGDAALEAYLRWNLRYPRLARETGIEGKMIVEAIIEKEGTIREATVVKGLGAGTEQEALRLVKSTSNWHPGRKGGQPVRVKIPIVVLFDL